MNLMLIILLVVMLGVLWWSARQGKKQKQQRQEYMDNLKTGTKVMTQSGIVGTITDIDGKLATIDSEGTKFVVVKAAITPLPDIFKDGGNGEDADKVIEAPASEEEGKESADTSNEQAEDDGEVVVEYEDIDEESEEEATEEATEEAEEKVEEKKSKKGKKSGKKDK